MLSLIHAANARGAQFGRPIRKATGGRGVLLGALLVLPLISCDGALGVTQPVEAPPFIEGLGIHRPVFRDGGMLSLFADPFDPSFSLPQGKHVPVEVTTSRGDAETLKLGPMLCGGYLCHLAYIEMRPGVSVLEFEESIRAAGARLGSPTPYEWQPQRGLLWALDGNVTRLTYELLRYPSVAKIERLTSRPFLPTPGYERSLLGGIPVANRPVRPRDGVLSFSPGDTIVLQYQNLGSVTLVQRVTNLWFNSP